MLVIIGAFIPLIGAPLAMVIAMVVALAANGLLNAALVGVGIALIGQLEGHIFQPFIMGRQVRLHPVVIALSVTAGTLIAGILGAVIAVPLVAVCWAIFSRLRTLDPPMEEEDDDASEVEPVDDVEQIEDERAGRSEVLTGVSGSRGSSSGPAATWAPGARRPGWSPRRTVPAVPGPPARGTCAPPCGTVATGPPSR